MTTVTCKISEELDARLESVARKERVSKSAVLRDALEQRLKARRHRPSAYDIVRHLCGSLRGPRDLSTNPKYLNDLGEQARNHR
jgi:Arc/MetJ-type ribon-helix-helix transcriptional regulator